MPGSQGDVKVEKRLTQRAPRTRRKTNKEGRNQAHDEKQGTIATVLQIFLLNLPYRVPKEQL